jgi:hypothetical protein
MTLTGACALPLLRILPHQQAVRCRRGTPYPQASRYMCRAGTARLHIRPRHCHSVPLPIPRRMCTGNYLVAQWPLECYYLHSHHRCGMGRNRIHRCHRHSVHPRTRRSKSIRMCQAELGLRQARKYTVPQQCTLRGSGLCRCYRAQQHILRYQPDPWRSTARPWVTPMRGKRLGYVCKDCCCTRLHPRRTRRRSTQQRSCSDSSLVRLPQ